MSNKKQVSVVIGSYNRIRFLKATIESIRKELGDNELDSEIIIVDGGSTDGTIEWLLNQKDIITIVQHNRGFWNGKELEKRSWGYFMNLGFKCAQGKYICMVSDDCLIIPNAIANGIKYSESKIQEGVNVGAVAFFWRNWPEMKKYWVGRTLGNKYFVNHGLYLASALNNVNYIDEESYSFYHADGDLCLKLWNEGYKCIVSEDSYVEHFSHANVEVRRDNGLQQKDDWETYLNKWDGVVYDRKNDGVGCWVEKSFSDDYLTYKKFPEL